MWSRLTQKKQGKFKSYSYWKKQKLESNADELIDTLYKQASERKKMRLKGGWVSEWCWCQKWLNEKRYEWVPEPPKPKFKPVKIEEAFVDVTPEKKAEIKAAFDKAMGKTRISKPRTESDIMQCKNKIIKELLKG